MIKIYEQQKNSHQSAFINLGCTGFLIGILLHSLFPYLTVPSMWLTIIFACSATFLFLFEKAVLRLLFLILFAISLGLWRFDMQQDIQPPRLRPFSPSGLAFSWDADNPSILILKQLRYRMTERAEHLFSQDESSLLTGILYGERRFSKPLKEQFRQSGLLHLVAVSGSNVTLLSALILPVLIMFRLSRKTSSLILSLFLIGFVGFVGFSASVVRAALMGWFVELAPIVGRLARPSRLLLLTACIFVFWKPWALIYDPGFALSFLAMWGLLSWSVQIDQRLETILPWQTVRKIFSASFGAMIMTLPYVAWAFGGISLWGLATNLLAMPLIPWIMISGLISLLFPSFVWIHLVTKGFLLIILEISRLIASIPFGYWPNVSLNFATLLGIYALLLALWHYTSSKLSTIPHLKKQFSVSSSNVVAAR